MAPCQKCQDSIPAIKGECMAILLWFLNLYYAGLGTLGASCLGPDHVIKDQIIVGVLQWLTGGCCFGWVWSVWWGSLIFKKHS